MGADTSIQWTNATWNPVRGCTRVSNGCRRCYAEGVAARFSGLHPGTGKPLAYHGLARQTDNGPRWTGKVVMVPEHLEDPAHWKKPKRIFVNSMSDMFHEKLTNEEIASVFRVMLNVPRHTYQVLTKRAKRMYEWTRWFASERGEQLPAHIHLGVSAEDQENADARLPYLVKTKARVKFVSVEPQVGPVDLSKWMGPQGGMLGHCVDINGDWWHDPGTCPGAVNNCAGCCASGISWVIVGGESGHGARPFDVEWARSIVRQCRAGYAAPFVKQLGGAPFDSTGAWDARDVLPLHGPDISEWGEDFAIREFPTA